jgi:hypothetical protein
MVSSLFAGPFCRLDNPTSAPEPARYPSVAVASFLLQLGSRIASRLSRSKHDSPGFLVWSLAVRECVRGSSVYSCAKRPRRGRRPNRLRLRPSRIATLRALGTRHYHSQKISDHLRRRTQPHHHAETLGSLRPLQRSRHIFRNRRFRQAIPGSAVRNGRTWPQYRQSHRYSLKPFQMHTHAN